MKTDEGYELIKGLIETGAANDPKVRSLLDRIAKGDADFKTTSEYSRIVSEILGTSFSEHILDLDGEAREEVCRMLLHDRYEDINDVLAEVQTSLDAKTGINIRPKKPPFQSERVASFAHSLADLTVADQVIKRRAKNGSANISMSDHDRYMKANAELRNKAGLKCYIERETDGKCCEWCTKMAGRYAYPDDTPKDVFRRHDNCGCSVTYKNGRQRQDVWSKKTWEADKDERISKASGKEPTVFTKADAQAKESEILAQRRLTYDRKRGIIIANHKMAATGQQPPDFSLYEVREDFEAVQAVKKMMVEELGILENNIDLSGIKNADVLEPFVNQLVRIQKDTAMSFPAIAATEIIDGDPCCIAGFKPFENILYISSKYFNSKEALLDTMKDWVQKGILPKQAKTIRYLAEHETAHIRIPDAKINNTEALDIYREFKNSPRLNQNSASSIYEFYADSVACYRISPSNTPKEMVKAVNFLKKEGIS